jgi:colicin import membrane protein
MKATAGRPQSVGRAATAGRSQLVEYRRVPLTSSLVLSLVLHGALVLWLLGSAWLLGRAQPYRLAPQTVFLVGDSPVAIDQVMGEGSGVPGAKQEGKEPGGVSKTAQGEDGAAPSVEKFVPPAEKPVPPPPKPVVEKSIPAPPPKPVVEKAVPPPPKPVVEKAAPPAPLPKPVVEKAVPSPPKPPPEAMTLAQKETKPTPPPAPPTSTPSEAQQKLAKLREKAVTEEQQRVAQLREQEAAEQRVASLRAEQRVAALRARVGSGDFGEGGGSSGSGTAGTGSGSGAPGGGRGTGAAGAGSTGTGGLSGIRLRTYQAELQAKITNAWNIPPQSKDLRAEVLLIIDRAGNVELSRLVQGSGNALFDESLQRAIKQAQPLPALPEDYAERSLRVTLNFRGRG